MPFDNTNPTNPTVAMLDRVREILSDPKRWTKDTYSGSDLDGSMTYCLIGAVFEAGADDENCPASQALARALGDGISVSGVIHYNDHPDTTHADVLALIDKARAITAPGEFDAV